MCYSDLIEDEADVVRPLRERRVCGRCRPGRQFFEGLEQIRVGDDLVEQLPQLGVRCEEFLNAERFAIAIGDTNLAHVVGLQAEFVGRIDIVIFQQLRQQLMELPQERFGLEIGRAHV